MRMRPMLMLGSCAALALLGACGSEGGGAVSSTPTPAPAVVSTPTPAVAPAPVSVNYDTAEYRRSNAAVQAQALAAYNAGATGSGVLAAVIDSGVDTSSAEFTGRISSLSGDYASTRTVQDQNGHGTAVADVLLGARNDSGIQGVAFNATLLALRTDTPGSCSTPSATSSTTSGCTHNDNAIAAALDAAVSAKARVVNISLGGAAANSRLRNAIDRATAAGTIIVISAGNDGEKDPTAALQPDALPQIAGDPVARGLVIIAGAVTAPPVDPTTGLPTGGPPSLANFSNKAGSFAAYYLAALGVKVRAVDNTGTSFYYDGTSLSAPVISGAVALLAQAFPNLTASQIVSLLYKTATDRGVAGTDNIYGNGELNIAAAFQPQGALSLTGSAVAVSLTDNATLSGAMGDAGQTGLSTMIHDEYGRDFGVSLGGTIRRSPRSQPLSSALALQGKSLSGGGARTSFAISIATPDTGAERLLLTRGQAEQASVLAGAMAVQIGKTTLLGIAAGRGADGLTAPNGGEAPAFLIGDRGIGSAPVGAFALRKEFSGIGLTVSAENGDVELWQSSALGPRADGVRRYRYDSTAIAADMARGPFRASLRLTRMHEAATILGARFGAALGGGGATTWFADAQASVTPFEGWRLEATLRRGWTAVPAGSLRDASTLVSQSLSLGVARAGLLMDGDRFGVRYAEPTRIVSGGLNLLLPGEDGITAQTLSLTPVGHERDVEAAYGRPLGGGWLTANAYLRRQPGNYRAAPDDMGAAVRYSIDF